MRVLVLTHNFPRFSGDPVGSFVLRLAKALAERDVECHVIAPSGPDLPSTGVIEDIPVTRFRYAPHRLETLAYTGTMGAQVRTSWRARLAMAGFLAAGYRAATRVLNRQRIHVMHAHWWFPGGLVARAVRSRTGMPYVVTLHGSDIRLAGATPGGASLFRSVSRRAAALTTVSSWLAREAQQLDPDVRPVVAPMPVRTELFHPPANGERSDNGLLFVGKLTDQKGLHHVLRAMPLMRRKAKLDVVGAGRVQDTAIRQLARELGIDDRITWQPLLTQQELAARYRAAAIHVIPAVEEGLGLTAAESLLCETPVVAFDSGGLPDIIATGTTGTLVPVGNVQALAVALDDLLDDRSARARFGAEGRRFALAHFSADAVGDRYAGILASAANMQR